MDRLTCYFDNETAVLRECCTFDRESGTEPDDCISCREMCEIKDGECSECPIQKAFNKLAEHEDLEKNGKLLKLPCAVGDMTYKADKREQEVRDFLVEKIEIDSEGAFVITSGPVYRISDFGKTVFLTKEQAEEELKRNEEVEEV